MITFIEVTDVNGKPGFIRSDVIEAVLHEPETGITRVFVSSNGFYRIRDPQMEIIAKLRDIESLKGMEGN